MRDFDENSITDAVLQRLAGAEDPRLRQVAQSLVKHLHGFVRDVEPSFEEWQAAISFLTRIGHMCDGKRQEFILLSDTLGVSMLVDAINHRMPEGATPTTVLGPFYVESAPELPLGAEVARAMKGEALHVSGHVSTAGGGPIAGAIVDIWHSDEDGYYDVQRADQPDANLRARFRTDAEGRFHFWTLTPTSYPVPDDGPVGELLRATGRHPMRPAHVHFMIAAPGHETLVTHVFVAGDPYLDSDAVFGVKQELIAEFTQYPAGEGPDGKVMNATWRKLEYDFALKRND
ncbi:MAG: intradiol ring-cleavage dioxygenase [Roseomonas sp.]|jgi:hydroxyquinol 1,2-dioxygenase|nr:intradiol ring-cleavage dioxygenase [Roseomonas sp.]